MHALWHRFTEKRIFREGEEPEVNCSNFTNTQLILISNGSLTIYVPRALQRAAPRPLILQHVYKAQLLVRLERFGTLSDIRICSSSYESTQEGWRICLGFVTQRKSCRGCPCQPNSASNRASALKIQERRENHHGRYPFEGELLRVISRREPSL